LQIKIMVLPQGHDPDSFITENGAEKFLSLAKNSITGLKFLIDMQLKEYRKDIPEEKVKIVREIIKEIENIPDAIIGSEYIKQTGELRYLGSWSKIDLPPKATTFPARLKIGKIILPLKRS
ncbi:unnamed protein product, partial [marine sediment metagenome]